MSTIEPRSVPASSWKDWLKEALTLSTRRWAVNTTVVFLILGLLAILPRACGVYLAPPSLALFAAIAHGTDSSRSLRESIREAWAGIARAGACAVAVIAFLYAATGVIVGLLLLAGAGTSSGRALPAPPAARVSDFPAGEGAPITLFLWLVVPLTFFLLPLLACARLSILSAIAMSLKAWDLNWFMWRISALTGLVCLAAAMWHGAAAVPLYPIIGSMMYVAYRHVFLNVRRKDEACSSWKCPAEKQAVGGGSVRLQRGNAPRPVVAAAAPALSAKPTTRPEELKAKTPMCAAPCAAAPGSASS